MTSDQISTRVHCCACEGTLRDGFVYVNLDRVAAWRFPTWGNLINGSSGRAMAFLCDRCFHVSRPAIFAVEFPEQPRDATPVYHAIADLPSVS